MLPTQHLILDAVHKGVADFGLYTQGPVAEFLGDVRALSKVILTHPDPEEVRQHLPADIADAFARARAFPHSKMSPSASRVRPGFAAPARAEITAAVTTIASQALTLDSVDQAAAALSWLFAPRPGTPAGKGRSASEYRVSGLVHDVQRGAALYHVTSGFDGPTPGRHDRTRFVPGLLWPQWSVALAPPQRHFRQTFQGISHALSVTLALIGPGDSIDQASDRLGACESPDRITELLHQIRTHPSWARVDAALKDLANYLDHDVCPIDYQRRRSLDYTRLLLEASWRELSRRAHHPSGANQRPLVVRRWLFERISCLPAEQAPAAFALHAPKHRAGISAFSRLLTPQLLSELDTYALEFLRHQGVTAEPVTWTPPITKLNGLDLPGTLVSQCPTGEIHRLLRDERLVPKTIANRLGISVDAVRCLLNEQPAPLNANQQRSSGRLVWRLADQISAEDLTRLHHHEKLSTRALTERFSVSEGTIARLFEIYNLPRTRRPRQDKTIDPTWLHREYVTNQRPLPALAKEVGVSTSHLRRQAQAAGIPIRSRHAAALVREHRFGPRQKKTAQDMLATGQHSLHEVAETLGFTTATIRRHTSKDDRRTSPRGRTTVRLPDT